MERKRGGKGEESPKKCKKHTFWRNGTLISESGGIRTPDPYPVKVML